MQTSHIWRVEKQMRQAVKSEERRYKGAKVRRKKTAPNVREVVKSCVFSMIRVSGQSKSRPVKAAGAEVGAERRQQKLHAALAKRTLGNEMRK